MVKGASNELNVDGSFAKTNDLFALGKYLNKLIHELEDMDNWVKDESLDIMTMPVSKFLYSRLHLIFHYNYNSFK